MLEETFAASALPPELLAVERAEEATAVASEESVKHPREMTPQEIEARIVVLGFGGSCDQYLEFREILKQELPAGTSVALRGSTVTGVRWEDGAPFDADGPGTSDLDITLIGDEVMNCWDPSGFYIPGLHTKPLCDKEPQIAEGLNPLRKKLEKVAGRPVNFQATNNLVLYARDILFDQPYYMLIEMPA